VVSIGQFARLLLPVGMAAVSQAPSPESNPNPPLPIKGKVVQYTTFNLIGGEFVQPRIRINLTLLLLWPASTIKPAVARVGPCFGQEHPRSHLHRSPRKEWLSDLGLFTQVLAVWLTQLSRRKRRISPSLGRQ